MQRFSSTDYRPGGTVNVLENSALPRVGSTSHFPQFPGCSGCCWVLADRQSERRRVPLAAVNLMKSPPLPHQTFHHIFPFINVYVVTSQVEKPSARRRFPGYFCQGSETTRTRTLTHWKTFGLSEGKCETL